MTAALRPSRLPDLDLRMPTSSAELVELVGTGCRPIAGGSDLLLEAAQRGEPTRVASTALVSELGRVDLEGERISVGAAVTLGRLCADHALRAAIPAVVDGAQRIGSVQLRTTATLAGNVCTASPAGDSVPGLFVHDAEVETLSITGPGRSVPITGLAVGPGETVLTPGEVVGLVRLRRLTDGEGSAYRRFTERNAIDLAFAGVAARVGLEADGRTVRAVRLALGAVGPTIVDATDVAAELVGGPITSARLGDVGEAAAAACSPISDHRCSADYRRHLVRILTTEVIELAAVRAASGAGR